MADRDKSTAVAIIGAGIGGCYLVAELDISGFQLRPHDTDDARLSAIRERRGIDVQGQTSGFAAVEHATTDLPTAIDGADVIIAVSGGNTHAVVARSLALRRLAGDTSSTLMPG